MLLSVSFQHMFNTKTRHFGGLSMCLCPRDLLPIERLTGCISVSSHSGHLEVVFWGIVLVFETASCDVPQTGLELIAIPLPQPPEV